MATRGITGPGTADDGSLQAAAIGGDGHAFAELYDRHERRVYGFCFRMLGTPHDTADATQETFVRMLEQLPLLVGRELDYAMYVLTVAREACYDAIEARGRVAGPVAGEKLPLWGPVEIANASLPPRQREVLALRELESLSYAEIGALVGIKENAVALLISRARIGLRNAIRGGPLRSVGTATADCVRALPLLAALQDGEESDFEDLEFLHSHLASCETCRIRREAMEEAGLSYRALLPIGPLAWLRHATIARAAELAGADWSDASGDVYGAGTPARVAFDETQGSPAIKDGSRRVYRWPALAALALCVGAVFVLASATGHKRGVPAVVSAHVQAVHPRALGRALGRRARRASKGHRKRAHSHRAVTGARAGAVVSVPRVTRSTSAHKSHGSSSPPAPAHRGGTQKHGGGHKPVRNPQSGSGSSSGGGTIVGTNPVSTTPTPTTGTSGGAGTTTPTTTGASSGSSP